MPTLRHTKSEEHLEINKTSPPKSETIDQKSETLSNGIENSQKQILSNNYQQINGKDIPIRLEKASESSNSDNGKLELHELGLTEDEVWSQEDDEITAQYLHLHKMGDRDTLSQMSLDSCDSREQSLYFFFLSFFSQ